MAMFTCDLCFLNFFSKGNLQRHQRNIHDNFNDKRKWSCVCGVKFYKSSDLQRHLQNAHHIETKKKEYFFNSYTKFLEWKEGIEEESFSFFPNANSTTDARGNVYERFICQMHGSSRSHTKSKPLSSKKWKKGSVKKDNACFASLIVRSVNREKDVYVSYTDTHTHPLTIQNVIHQPIPPSFKKKATYLLSLGVPVNKVHDDLTKSKFLKPESEELLTRKDLVNLKAVTNLKENIKKASRLHNNENISLSLQVAALDKASSILIFKEKGSDPNIGPSNLPGLKAETFILGYQSPSQARAMANALDQMLFIDETHGIHIRRSEHDAAPSTLTAHAHTSIFSSPQALKNLFC